ncbi:DUF2860 family protein [Photobacterium nomapromontoriensis]|uniref:DUF2860 family protein n=1 Tax=Photobacterium nomapromontoriensis TaxID=2910237 RepID=UPI003D14EA4A
MKKNIVITLLGSLITSSAVAGVGIFDASRFSGELFLNTGFATSDSNLSTKQSAMVQQLDESSNTKYTYLIAPFGNINYAINSKNTQRFYLGTSRDDIAVGTLAFELGYQHDFTSGTTLDISYLPTIMSGEVWKNPYLIGSPRSKTDQEGNAFRIKLANIMRSGVTIDTAYTVSDIDDERITDSTLHRGGDSFYLRGKYLNMLNRGSGLIYSLGYTNRSADGKAASFSAYEAEITYFIKSGRHSTAITSSYIYRHYDAINPVFKQEQSDDELSLFIAYEYENFAGWGKQWAVTTLASYGLNRSNIDFYNSNEALLLVGLRYSF